MSKYDNWQYFSPSNPSKRSKFAEKSLPKPAELEQMSRNSTFKSDEDEKTSFLIKTLNDLRKSILEFGSYRHEFAGHDDGQLVDSSLLQSEGFLSIPSFSLLKESRSGHEDSLFERIRPGLSAKRYLASWTRRWRPELFEHLAREGKIKEASLFEPSEILPNVKHRINDDLSRTPLAYRLQRQWLSLNFPPLVDYQFYRMRTGMMGLGKFFSSMPKSLTQ